MSSAKKMTLTTSRITCGSIWRAVSQIASGGPLVVVDVVSTPTENPAASAAPRPGCRCRRGRLRARKRARTIAQTITPTAIRIAVADTIRTISAPIGSPGMAAARAGRTALQSTCGRRRSPNSTSTFTTWPRISTRATAAAGSITAYRTGPAISANPKPVAACTVAAISRPSAAMASPADTRRA